MIGEGGVCKRVLSGEKSPISYNPEGIGLPWDRARLTEDELLGPWFLWPRHRFVRKYVRPWDKRELKRFAEYSKDPVHGRRVYQRSDGRALEALAMKVGPLGRFTCTVTVGPRTVLKHSRKACLPAGEYLAERVSDWAREVGRLKWLSEFIYLLGTDERLLIPHRVAKNAEPWPGAESLLCSAFDTETLAIRTRSRAYDDLHSLRGQLVESRDRAYDLTERDSVGLADPMALGRYCHEVDDFHHRVAELQRIYGTDDFNTWSQSPYTRYEADEMKLFLGTCGISPHADDTALANKCAFQGRGSLCGYPTLTGIAGGMIDYALNQGLRDGVSFGMSPSNPRRIEPVPRDLLGFLYFLLAWDRAGGFPHVQFCAGPDCEAEVGPGVIYCSRNCGQKRSRVSDPKRLEQTRARGRDRRRNSRAKTTKTALTQNGKNID